ncbi:MAG: polysaccharide deacetylase family protein [Proteobacteria bacterium]|nr:polysaccharide deacetylase family protein [Pseudomonadota bacterium]
MGELLQRLGFGDDARVAILHVDDLGMHEAANRGGFEVLERGVATCGSLMVPCPAFAAAAAHARAHPELDLGVHLTLNAEWEGYRWGPVAGADAVPSLVDDDGNLLASTALTLARAQVEDVRTELRAQVRTALEAGIDVTHLDSHMGTVLAPSLLPVYRELALEFSLPVFAAAPTGRQLEAGGFPAALEPVFRKLASELAEDGIPVLDGFDANSLGFAPGEGRAHNERRLRSLGPGVHYVILHAAEGSGLAGVTTDAHCREFEREFYGESGAREVLEQEGIHTLGMRPLRALLRTAAS